MNKFTLTLAFLLGISLTGLVQGAWAQANLGDVPREIKFDIGYQNWLMKQM